MHDAARQFVHKIAGLQSPTQPSRDDVQLAIDPVCKMQVRLSDAPARTILDGRTYYFCSVRCRDRFLALHPADTRDDAEPAMSSLLARRVAEEDSLDAQTEYIDPICGMSVTPETAGAHRNIDGIDVYFCAQ